MNQDTDFSASNLVLMIGGQILFIVLALLVLFFGTDITNGTNEKNSINSKATNKNAPNAPK